METKICSTCGVERSLGWFAKIKKNNKEYRRNKCQMCRDPKIYQKSAQRQKVRRLNPLERATFILVDSRREDKKKTAITT